MYDLYTCESRGQKLCLCHVRATCRPVNAASVVYDPSSESLGAWSTSLFRQRDLGSIRRSFYPARLLSQLAWPHVIAWNRNYQHSKPSLKHALVGHVFVCGMCKELIEKFNIVINPKRGSKTVRSAGVAVWFRMYNDLAHSFNTSINGCDIVRRAMENVRKLRNRQKYLQIFPRV
ncbi:hypothetical protein BDQ17DRAFT_1405809 [Cyathus striatus]|nr:hypothetical protein BDQ17DRAFT_1405809 [Cyathus striatus]